jgi:hypothetical protein
VQVDFEELTAPARLSVPGHGEKKYDFGLIWDFVYKVEGSGACCSVRLFSV